jgi:hypothetical protein
MNELAKSLVGFGGALDRRKRGEPPPYGPRPLPPGDAYADIEALNRDIQTVFGDLATAFGKLKSEVENGRQGCQA